jgi:hypothetical protein
MVDVDILFAFQLKSVCSLFIAKGRLLTWKIGLRMFAGDIGCFVIWLEFVWLAGVIVGIILELDIFLAQ